jgi:hypothetical protein
MYPEGFAKGLFFCLFLKHYIFFDNINIFLFEWLLIKFSFMVLNVTFNNISVISWQSVLLVEENGVPEKTTDQQQVTDKLLSHNVVWSRPCLIGIQMHNVNGYWH